MRKNTPLNPLSRGERGLRSNVRKIAMEVEHIDLVLQKHKS
jgi:hypothetical protein